VRGGVIGISQSGAAPDVAAVVSEARAAKAATIAITNRGGSLLARAAERTFLLRAGPERAIAATKTYTATCVALALIAAALAEARGSSALLLAGLDDAMDEAAAAGAEARRVARALECALKVKELGRVWAEPYSSADFRHGPIAVLGRGMPVVMFAARGPTASEGRATLTALRRRGARVYVVTNDPAIAERADGAVLLERPLSEALTPITFAVVAQHLAIALARQRGLDPERPAGLSKVTRTR
jgi:glucosamine--fructose-6-phosphate aminotransferase (isomerizing)